MATQEEIRARLQTRGGSINDPDNKAKKPLTIKRKLIRILKKLCEYLEE